MPWHWHRGIRSTLREPSKAFDVVVHVMTCRRAQSERAAQDMTGRGCLAGVGQPASAAPSIMPRCDIYLWQLGNFDDFILFRPVKTRPMSPPFIHPPIVEANGFRVLRLEPAIDRDAVLRGSLQSTTFSSDSNDLIEGFFTALSYVWGDPTPVDMILLDGCECPITANLSAALRDIRDPSRVHRLWADAICIDQKNTKERNHQVTMMQDIYSSASNTIIYLGGLTPLAAEILDAAASMGPKSIPLLKLQDEDARDLPSVLEALAVDVLMRPWFRRAWVFQELVRSQVPWVQCGRKRVRWSGLCSFVEAAEHHLRASYPRYNSCASSLAVLHKMENQRRQFSQANPNSGTLHDVLKFRCGCETTEPRDMIFAYIGISTDRKKFLKQTTVDYDLSIRALYIKTATYMFREGWWLIHEGYTDSPIRSLLPSWVPDWGTPITEATLNKERRLMPQVPQDPDILLLRRLFKGDIDHISDILPKPSFYQGRQRQLCMRRTKQWRALLESWVAFTQPLSVKTQSCSCLGPCRPRNWLNCVRYFEEFEAPSVYETLIGYEPKGDFPRGLSDRMASYIEDEGGHYEQHQYRIALTNYPRGIYLVADGATIGDTIVCPPDARLHDNGAGCELVRRVDCTHKAEFFERHRDPFLLGSRRPCFETAPERYPTDRGWTSHPENVPVPAKVDILWWLAIH
ncbi:heterokaryon incompatibility protein-domain-containing protein [Xylariomycetidae sp. FL0641]|nr:heterokaryon incompatibility protein-domain-containing protein [Xylariomycetidae sp. FL0641]